MRDPKLTARRGLDSTRDRLLALLRKGDRSVDDLARAVGLTPNAVRAHLTTLERDGLIRVSGVRRGPAAGKPATLYEVSPDVELLFSRAYAPVLAAVVEAVGERLSPPELEAVMRDAGRRVAMALGTPVPGEFGGQVAAAAEILGALGGDVEIHEADGVTVLRGCGCPLALAVKRRPESCYAVESLLEQVTGMPVAQQCERGPRPNCRFVIGGDDRSGQRRR